MNAEDATDFQEFLWINMILSQLVTGFDFNTNFDPWTDMLGQGCEVFNAFLFIRDDDTHQQVFVSATFRTIFRCLEGFQITDLLELLFFRVHNRQEIGVDIRVNPFNRGDRTGDLR